MKGHCSCNVPSAGESGSSLNHRAYETFLDKSADWKRKLQRGLLLFYSPIFSKRVKACMFAKMTRSSSLVDSSRQLFKFAMTSPVNCDELGSSFGPHEHLNSGV